MNILIFGLEKTVPQAFLAFHIYFYLFADHIIFFA